MSSYCQVKLNVLLWRCINPNLKFHAEANLFVNIFVSILLEVLPQLPLAGQWFSFFMLQANGQPWKHELNVDHPVLNSQLVNRGYYISTDGSRITEHAPSPIKWQHILPMDLDDEYANWIPCGDLINKDDEPADVPDVVSNVEVKCKWYLNSVHFSLSLWIVQQKQTNF